MPSALLESETVISKNTIADTSLLLMMNFSLRSSATAKCSKSSDISILNKKNIFPVIQKLIDKI
jgi:primosomal protein N' (replication factor Y)